MNIVEAIDIVTPIEHRCLDCGQPILEPNRELCKHCESLRYADSDADQLYDSYEDKIADESGLPKSGPL